MAPKRAAEPLGIGSTRIAPAASRGSWGQLSPHAAAFAAIPGYAAAGPAAGCAPAAADPAADPAASPGADRATALDAGVDAWSGALDEAGGAASGPAHCATAPQPSSGAAASSAVAAPTGAADLPGGGLTWSSWNRNAGDAWDGFDNKALADIAFEHFNDKQGHPFMVGAYTRPLFGST